MTISRRNVLLGSAAALGAAALPLGSSARAAGDVPFRRLITVFAYGGTDDTWALDPKPGLSTVDVGAGDVTMFGDLPIFTHANRPAVTSFFQKYGSLTAVVNGVQMRSLNHPDCTKRILTGTPSEGNPDMGSIVSFERGADLPAPYLVLGPSAFTGPYASIAARAGSVNQIRALLDPANALPKVAPFDTPRFEPDTTENDLMRKYVAARAERERAIRGQHGYNAARYADFIASLERADVLKDFSDGFGDDFTFTLGLREQIGLGLDAIERGVSHSIHLEQAFATWDTHANNAQQEMMWNDLYDGLTFLIDELVARPGTASGSSMMDETVVAVLSEMGRTPKLNAEAGKDHWPITSALVVGAGVRGGRAYGGSDDHLQARNIDLHTGDPDDAGQQLQYSNLVAGILTLAGVDSSAYLPNSEAFDAFVA